MGINLQVVTMGKVIEKGRDRHGVVCIGCIKDDVIRQEITRAFSASDDIRCYEAEHEDMRFLVFHVLLPEGVLEIEKGVGQSSYVNFKRCGMTTLCSLAGNILNSYEPCSLIKVSAEGSDVPWSNDLSATVSFLLTIPAIFLYTKKSKQKVTNRKQDDLILFLLFVIYPILTLLYDSRLVANFRESCQGLEKFLPNDEFLHSRWCYLSLTIMFIGDCLCMREQVGSEARVKIGGCPQDPNGVYSLSQ